MADPSINLVVGATGRLGGLICRTLLERGEPVRAVVRGSSDASRVARLRDAGAELVEADLRDPQSLRHACGDCNVFSTATGVSGGAGDTIAATDLEGHLALIDAARDASVRHFVHVSFSSNVEPAQPSPLTLAKRRVEGHLARSGLGYTILRSGPFMEVWLSPSAGFDYLNARVTLYGSGESLVSWLSMRDLAVLAVESSYRRAAHDRVLETGGPEALSALEVVRVFEELSGKTFDVRHVTEQELLQRKERAEGPLERSIAGLLRQLARGDAIDMRETLGAIPLRLTSVREYARAALDGRPSD